MRSQRPTPDSKLRHGFTLMELMITVVIVGILASMAVARYQRTIERGYWQTARDILQTIYSGEIVHWTTNSQYFAPAASADWPNIHMDDPNGVIPVTFTVVVGVGPPPTFTATATRNGGPCDTRTQTVDQAHVFTTPAPIWPQTGTC